MQNNKQLAVEALLKSQSTCGLTSFVVSTRPPWFATSPRELAEFTIEASQAQMDFFNANVESTGSTTFVVPQDDGLNPISDLTIILTDGLEGP